MNEVKEIFGLRDRDFKLYIKIQIGDVRLTIRQPNFGYPIDDEDKTFGYSEVVLVLPDLKKKIHVSVGDEMHDNKLEVLKSEFEYEKCNR